MKEPGWAFDNWTLYNIDGFQLRRKGDSLKCIVSDYDFLRELGFDVMGIIDSTSHLSNDTIIYSKINDINEDRFTQKQIYKQFDYTLVLYWSSWRGRYSSQILKLEKEFVLNHPELRIQVIRVNMDFREEMKNTGLNKLQITADEIQQRNAHNNK